MFCSFYNQPMVNLLESSGNVFSIQRETYTRGINPCDSISQASNNDDKAVRKSKERDLSLWISENVHCSCHEPSQVSWNTIPVRSLVMFTMNQLPLRITLYPTKHLWNRVDPRFVHSKIPHLQRKLRALSSISATLGIEYVLQLQFSQFGEIKYVQHYLSK